VFERDGGAFLDIGIAVARELLDRRGIAFSVPTPRALERYLSTSILSDERFLMKNSSASLPVAFSMWVIAY